MGVSYAGLQEQESLHHGREPDEQHRGHHAKGALQQESGSGGHALFAEGRREGRIEVSGKGISKSLATVLLGVLCPVLARPEPGD